MKDHATLSELVSGIRFITAVERTSGNKDQYFYYEMDKAEASSSPREVHHFADSAIKLVDGILSFDALSKLKEMAEKHPMFGRAFQFVTDQNVEDYLMTIGSQSLKNLCRACDVLVDKDRLQDSAKEVSVLSAQRLMALMVESQPEEFEGRNRQDIFEMAVYYFDVTRQQRKIDDFLKTALNTRQRDNLLGSLGINIYDEDYEEDLEESRIASEMITDELDVMQGNAEWVDWTNWKPEDETLAVFEALVYAYEKLTEEVAAEMLKQLPNPNED